MANAITAERVSKHFRLYHERNQSLKATIMRRGRARYEKFWALDDVSFEVAEGETFGLIGHNGSGKSTMLKCLARILRPDRGEISTTGKVSALLELGAGFHQELSGRENVYLNGSILGLSGREVTRRFDEIVEFAGLERFIDMPVKNYSSGMYVRLGFSVAINVDPDILLVDEVLAVGDEEFQRRCNERFADLRAEGTTIVVVSHGLGSIESMCDRAAWLDHGELRGLGPAEEVVDSYLGQVRVSGTRRDAPAAAGGDLALGAITPVDGKGVSVERVRSGEPVTLRIEYHADEPVRRPLFRVMISTSDGILVAIASSKGSAAVGDVVSGAAAVDLVVPSVPMLPGTYDVAVLATDQEGLREHDRRRHACRLEVAPGAVHSEGGILDLGASWQAATP